MENNRLNLSMFIPNGVDDVLFKDCSLFDNWFIVLSNGFVFCSIEELENYTIKDLFKFNLELTKSFDKLATS